MSISSKREKAVNIAIQAGIVVFLLFFFIRLCPLVVFDCDDWLCLGAYRLPIPRWKEWEPTRIMPGTLMPVAGWMAAHIIYPICGDYVYSVTIISSCIITFLIVVMCICFQKVLIVRAQMPACTALMCEILFLVSFFAIFRNRGTSQCMFTAADLCCIYYYTMSGVLNAIVVLLLLQWKDVTEKFLSWNLIRKTGFCILVYFALFSNLFHSAITAIYAGAALLFALYHCKDSFKEFVRKNMAYLFILAGWGIVLVLEITSGRAEVVGGESGLNLALSVQQLIAILLGLSKRFVVVILLLAVGIALLLGKRRLEGQGEFADIFAMLLCNGILLTIFLLLLNSKTAYMSRIDASWGIWFYLIAATVVMAAYIAKSLPLMTKLLPIAIPICVIATALPDGKFLMSTREHTDYQTCIQLNKYVINHIMEASQEGKEEIVIRIPDHSEDLRSLTYNEALGITVADCLYIQGIIERKPDVKTVLDKEMSDSDVVWPE
ncbi:hypothetical protein [Parablautia muri]|uniref:Uncharacterized protein n=1 Tax=Parablautia muri TaxID=2320879 RepID=A0A9X5GRR2_9FIRM|nr:hypothetical protein [Parablautia muri]NBJ91332.1 hypothetical protein [Parablautia muri]